MLDTYSEARVVLAPSGELLIALPIYANQNGAIFDEEQMKQIFNLKGSVGIYEKFGYLMYHPSQEFSFYMKGLDLFTDLGVL